MMPWRKRFKATFLCGWRWRDPPRPLPRMGRGFVGVMELFRFALAEELGGDTGRREDGATTGSGVNRAAGRFVGLPLERDGVRRPHRERDHGLHEGGVRRERAAITTALFPGDQGAAPVQTAADEDPDVLIRPNGAG